MMYSLLFRLLLRRWDAEEAHNRGLKIVRFVLCTLRLRTLANRLTHVRSEALHVRALGLDFPNPLGLAAGFDKEAECFDDLAAMGFGFVEIGTATAKPQVGSDKPRLYRLLADRALLNRMGFPNSGAEEIAARLAGRAGQAIIGVNIGKSRITPAEDAIDDYLTSTRWLADYADYIVVNVSSPNTPGLRDLEAVGPLRTLLLAVQGELARRDRRVPLLVKISPELSDDGVDAIARLALELQLDGVVAVNTTLNRDGLKTEALALRTSGAGGISGPPTQGRATDVLRRLYRTVGDQVTLISVGGVDSPEEAWRRIRSGASLVQAYTAFVYEGPLWPRRMQSGLARLLAESEFATVQDAIGADLRLQSSRKDGNASADPVVHAGTQSRAFGQAASSGVTAV